MYASGYSFIKTIRQNVELQNYFGLLNTETTDSVRNLTKTPYNPHLGQCLMNNVLFYLIRCYSSLKLYRKFSLHHLFCRTVPTVVQAITVFRYIHL